MPDFPELLNRFIKEKKIHVYSMVKYCGIDRSTMYKIISGKRRPPSPEIRDRMCAFMHLTPDETRQFEQAWQISVTGKTVYYRRKAVEEFLSDFPLIPSGSRSPKPELPEAPVFPGGSGCFSFSDRNTFLSCLKFMLDRQTGIGKGRIGILMQPISSSLFQYLNNPRLAEIPVRIDHIFCLERVEQLTETNEYLSCRYLGNILPLIANRLDYHPWCFYDDIQAHFSNLNLFPIMILTDEYVLTCTSQCTEGILYSHAGILQMMWKLFDSYKSSCQPFFVPTSAQENTSIEAAPAKTGKNIQIFRGTDNLYLKFPDIKKQTICLSLREPGLTAAFFDYIETKSSEEP